MDAKSLKFHTIKGNAPEMTCNACGNKGVAVGWLICEIPLPDGSNDHYNIVACSYECKRQFCYHPMANRFISEGIASAMETRANGRQETAKQPDAGTGTV